MTLIQDKYINHILTTEQITRLIEIYNNAGDYKTKAMKKGGPTMTIAKLRAAAKKKGYKLVKA